MKTVEFFFDFLSPYSWLACKQLPGVKVRTGAQIRFVPVLLAGLLKAHESQAPAEIPAKRRYVFLDVMRTALQTGLPFQGPPAHPFNPLKPLRCCTALEREEDRECLATAFFEAAWERGLDLTSDMVLREVTRAVGMDPGPLLELSQTAHPKELLRKNTEMAVAKGVFGVPSFYVDGELFWGNDRLPMLEAFLTGKLDVDRAKLDEILGRPRGVERTK